MKYQYRIWKDGGWFSYDVRSIEDEIYVHHLGRGRQPTQREAEAAAKIQIIQAKSAEQAKADCEAAEWIDAA